MSILIKTIRKEVLAVQNINSRQKKKIISGKLLMLLQIMNQKIFLKRPIMFQQNHNLTLISRTNPMMLQLLLQVRQHMNTIEQRLHNMLQIIVLLQTEPVLIIPIFLLPRPIAKILSHNVFGLDQVARIQPLR